MFNMYKRNRMFTNKTISIASLSLIATSTTSHVFSEWLCKESDHFSLYYPSSFEYLTDDYLMELEHYRPYVVEKTGHDYPYKAPILLEDRGSFHNAFADFVNERIIMHTEGPNSNNTAFALTSNWLSDTTLHELTHLYHLTYTEGSNTIKTSIMGNLSSPQISCSNWFIEGLAVWSESGGPPTKVD